MKQAELFAGTGALGMAVNQVFGSTTAWYSEYAAAPAKILKHHWPTKPNHGDITKIDWHAVEPVQIVSGGSPCQDLSLSGARLGMTEGTRSGLWENMREAIAILKPTYVVWENVRGALSAEANSGVEFCPGCMGNESDCHLRALGRVLGDLASLGYDTRWCGLRAADVGAPHGRYRIFVLATDPRSVRSQEGQPAAERRTEGQNRASLAVKRGSHHQTVWGKYAPAIHRWERVLGRPAPRPTEPDGRDGQERISAAFEEWMMGLPDGHVTTVPDLSWDDMLTALGNGVVPQQAVAALHHMKVDA